MSCDDQPTLTFETLLTDPLIRLVMVSDGVTQQDFEKVLEIARSAACACTRERWSLADMVPLGTA